MQSDIVNPRLKAEYGSIQENGFWFFALEKVKQTKGFAAEFSGTESDAMRQEEK